MTDRPLSVAERDILRAAIRNHPEWKAYRQANHIDASGLNAGECRRACAVMKIDIEATLAAAAATETNSTEGTEDMKDRSVAPLHLWRSRDRLSRSRRPHGCREPGEMREHH